MPAKPLRIAIIGSRGVPASYGGVERHVEELYTRLSALGIEATIYCRRHYIEPNRALIQNNRNQSRYKNLNLIVSLTPRRPGIEALYHSFIASLRAGFGPYDICHYHSLGPAPFSILPRLAGKKILVTIHARDWQRAKWGKVARAYLRFCERYIARRIANIVVVSPELQQAMRDEYGRETTYIPNGTNIPQPIPAATAPAPYELESGAYILYFGRISPEKDVATLIRAYQQAAPREKLVIVGADEPGMQTLDQLKALASSNPELAHRILFTGYLYGDALQRLIANARFTVNPSRLEGLPLAVLEAHAHGKHTLASDIPAHRALIDDPQWLFPAGDTDALAEAIKKRLAEDLTPRNEALIEEIHENYNWDSIAQKTLALLQSL